jgi:hypothetical protein
MGMTILPPGGAKIGGMPSRRARRARPVRFHVQAYPKEGMPHAGL